MFPSRFPNMSDGPSFKWLGRVCDERPVMLMAPHPMWAILTGPWCWQISMWCTALLFSKPMRRTTPSLHPTARNWPELSVREHIFLRGMRGASLTIGLPRHGHSLWGLSAGRGKLMDLGDGLVRWAVYTDISASTLPRRGEIKGRAAGGESVGSSVLELDLTEERELLCHYSICCRCNRSWLLGHMGVKMVSHDFSFEAALVVGF